jgi:hypothetical protein
MNTIPHANRHRFAELFAKWIMGLVVLIAVAGLAAPPLNLAAPMDNTESQKTTKQCKNEEKKCLKSCDSLIDVGNNIKRCKDECADQLIMCLPLRSDQPGSKLKGMRPSVLPGKNAPIMRRGVEGAQTSEPSSEVPEQTDQTGGTK